MSFGAKLLNFVTGGLPSEIVKQVGDHFAGKKKKELAAFEGELAYDLKVLDITAKDPLCTRQGIAWSFHLFMWISKLWTGNFPNDVIFSWGQTDVSIGFIYVLIIFFYFPARSLEKIKKAFKP